ncbi:hypothetical protein Sango_2944800 [Sesamum angolense]|uniref:Aminotransferase-like plant mobile domain-containing protein n=1 Tax=Sesamum angolense TaxID=2727404 RepID=A0AAE1VUZ7_9LAMI|nr:hypothetical protein Sango_2944800 [Sesamum angolense]
MSISLWDLHELVGLPMTGCLYDEVVPSALELTGVDEKRERFIPRSSKYLVYAYHLLQSADDNQCSHVSIDKWVKFWSKKTTKYHPPPPRKEKKMVRPKSTHNPLGDIAIHESGSTAEEALFAKLCIERNLKEEVYLAAYLACWLCVFVLPGKDVNSIRPSTFKMASLMGNGRRVNLAIPVFASIYEGLNTVATSPKPAGTSHSFPIHFVYAWLACYFKTHYSVWQELHGPKMTRFSGEGASLEEGLRYWRLCVLSKSSSKAWFPCLPANAKKLYSEAYKAWWAKVYGTFFYDNIACSIRPKSIKITLKRKKDEDKQVDGGENDPPHALIPPVVIECDPQATVAEASKGKCSSHNALEDEVQSIDVGEESETSHSSTMTPPLGMGLRRKQSPPPAAVSVLKVDFLSSIEDDVYLILESMKSFQKFDVSKVEESLNMFFAKVHAYNEARSLSSKKLSQSQHEQQLKEVKARLQVVQAKANEKSSEIQSAMDELEHVEADIAVLKGRRTNLRATLKEKKQLNHDTQAKVHEVEKDLVALESTGPLDDAIV